MQWPNYMNNKICGLILLISSNYAIAGKGILFDIGEKLIKMDGFSYEELEKKNENFLRSRNLCDQKTQPISVSLENKNKKLIGCPLGKQYKLYPNERDIGYSIVDIMQTGCRGLMKYKKETTKPNSSPEITEYTTNIIAQRDRTFKHLTLLRDKKRLFKVDNEFMDTSERRVNEVPMESIFNNYRPGGLPSVVLGRIYDVQMNNTNPYNGSQSINLYQYNVMENEEKKLEVTITGQTGGTNQQGHTSITNFEIYCTTKSLAEIEEYAKNGAETKANQELSKKVFGD